MGKPLDKIVATIKSQLTGHLTTDDSRLEGELIEDMVLDVRASLIVEYYRSKRFLEDSFFQINDAVLIESEKVTPVAGISEENPDIFAKVPALQSNVGYSNIRYFGTFDGRNGFARLSISGFNATDGKLFTRNDSYYTVSGTKFLIKNMPNLGIKYLRLIAVSYDPREVPNYDPTKDFPLPGGMIHKAELICIKQLMSTLGLPADVINDAQDVLIKEQAQ